MIQAKSLYHAWILFNKKHVSSLTKGRKPHRGHSESTCLICLVGQDILRRTLTNRVPKMVSSLSAPTGTNVLTSKFTSQIS